MNFRQLLAAKSRSRRVYTAEQIAALKADLAAGMSMTKAVREHKLPRWLVRDVLERRSWRDIEPKGRDVE